MLTETNPEPKAYILHGCKGQYNIQSQSPAIRFAKCGRVFHIRADNIKKPEANSRTIFGAAPYPAGFDPKNLVKAFAGQHFTPNLSEEDAVKLTKWGAHKLDEGKPDDAKLGGLHCVAFKVNGDFWLDRPSDEPSGQDLVGDHEQLKPLVRSRGHNEFAK